MWLSARGQTATIRTPARVASASQVMAERLTPRTMRERHAAPSTNGDTHQMSNGRSSRMMAVSWRTESGTPTSSRGDCTGRVHMAGEVACELQRRGQRAGGVDDSPCLDADGLDGTVPS